MQEIINNILKEVVMNILIITPVGDYRGGAERSIFETIKILTNYGHKLTMVTSNNGDFSNEINRFGSKVIIVNIRNNYIDIGKKNFLPALFCALRMNYRLFYLVKKNSFDLILLNSSGIIPWIFLVILFLDLNRVIIQIRAYRKLNILIKFLYKILGKRLTIIFNSKFMKNCYINDFENKIPWNKDYVLYNPFDLRKFNMKNKNTKLKIRNQLGIKKSDFFIVYVGRIHKSKQIHIIIEALSFIPKSERIYFAIIGNSVSKEELLYKNFLQKTIIYNNYKKNVKFLGFRKDINVIMNTADLLILPSKEAFGRVIVEAQACGTLVIAANSGGAVEALDPDLGLLFKEGDVDDLARKINNVLYDKKNYFNKDFKIKIHKRLDYKFGLKRYIKNLLNIINESNL